MACEFFRMSHPPPQGRLLSTTSDIWRLSYCYCWMIWKLQLRLCRREWLSVQKLKEFHSDIAIHSSWNYNSTHFTINNVNNFISSVKQDGKICSTCGDFTAEVMTGWAMLLVEAWSDTGLHTVIGQWYGEFSLIFNVFPTWLTMPTAAYEHKLKPIYIEQQWTRDDRFLQTIHHLKKTTSRSV